jgi:hypothetical protein
LGIKFFLAVAAPAASRSGFYPAAAAMKKVAAKPQSQPPGKNSTAETSIFHSYHFLASLSRLLLAFRFKSTNILNTAVIV